MRRPPHLVAAVPGACPSEHRGPIARAALALLALALTPVAFPATALLSYEKEIVPLFEKYCHECHGDGMKKGEFVLDVFKTAAANANFCAPRPAT